MPGLEDRALRSRTSALAAMAVRSRSVALAALVPWLACACGGEGGVSRDRNAVEGDSTRPVLRDCEAGSRDACKSFVAANGVEIELGELGAIMDPNVGVGFENTIASGDADGGTTCQLFSRTFRQDAAQTEQLLDTSTLKFDLYTVYRPARWQKGVKYPIVTWGNGTCAQPEGYGALLRYVASHGFVVVAANSRWVGGAEEMLRGIDYLASANDDERSPYYQRLDTSKVAAMGHSQGGMGAVNAARDERVSAVVLFNGGSSAVKPFLSVSGERDIFTRAAEDLKEPVEMAEKAAFLFYHKVPKAGNFTGHLTLMLQPERVIEPTVAWLKYTLLEDEASKQFFAGEGCALCGNDEEYEFGQHGIE